MDQQINELIKHEIDNNEVCLFMKGTQMHHNVASQWQYQICLKF